MGQFNAAVTAQFAAETNYLPSVRFAIKDNFPRLAWGGQEAAVTAVDLRAAAAFTVRLNDETQVEAVAYGGQYVVQFAGTIQYIVFTAATTLTYFWCEWSTQSICHNIPQFIGVEGTSVSVSDTDGNALYPDEDGNYELAIGLYLLEASAEGYETLQKELPYCLENTVVITGQVEE